jgi:hypothetical protein
MMVQTELTANRIGGLAIGAMIFAGFGAGWLFWSLVARQEISAGTAIAVEMGALVLLGAAAYVKRQARRWPRVARKPGMWRTFAWINVIEWTGVVAVGFGFSRLHIGAYVAPAVTAIVGLHLLPLARLFHYPMHHVTGAVLVGWGAASCLLFTQAAMEGATALGTGVILWLSALGMLLLSMREMGMRVDAVTNGR